MSQGSQSIDRASEILALIISSAEPVTYTQVVAATGLARSTVSRLLQALERNGLLERDPDGAFRGGALFAQYATRFDRVQSLVAAAEPSLQRIGDRTGETVTLAAPSGHNVMHLAQVDSKYVLGATNWADIAVPAHASALGKAMYAYAGLPLPKGRLRQCTPSTLASGSALVRDLDGVRALGYALTHGEFEKGLDAVAVPVRGADGVVVAAMGISGPSHRFAGKHTSYGELLVEEAEMVSAVLRRQASAGHP